MPASFSTQVSGACSVIVAHLGVLSDHWSVRRRCYGVASLSDLAMDRKFFSSKVLKNIFEFDRIDLIKNESVKKFESIKM